MQLKEFDNGDIDSNEWELKDICLESVCLELYSMLQELKHKINTGRIRDMEHEKMRLQYYKTFINGCNVLSGMLNQFEDVKSEKSKKRQPISAKTRMRILERDNYTCQHCGAKISDGVCLHIDHIKPLAKGGTNDENNLQVLCSECNLAKNDNDSLSADKQKLIELGVI